MKMVGEDRKAEQVDSEGNSEAVQMLLDPRLAVVAVLSGERNLPRNISRNVPGVRGRRAARRRSGHGSALAVRDGSVPASVAGRHAAAGVAEQSPRSNRRN